ncbi:MAG: ubiquinone/menaquinone biosynthesis methyltransferase [Armatimonadetes bacterium]|nr:ubiquinone/menaquinone biosynthesis methyltransferase [Armatimonadota bacterium]
MTNLEPKGTEIWLTEGEEKRARVQHMFAEIAPSYDLLNSVMSLSLHKRWRQIAARKLNLKQGGSALDVCCGTGDFLPILRSFVGERGIVMGTDFCAPMLERAASKDPASTLSLGDACQLPFASGGFDGVTVGWGIRNVPDIDLAHREIYRVLRPGGRFVSVDMAIPNNPITRGVSQLLTQRLLPALGRMFGKTEAYTYLPKSTERFLDREGLAQSMRSAGFTDVNFKNLFFGNICIHWGQKP